MAPGEDAALLPAPEVMARVRAIQLRTRRLVSSALSGSYRSTFRGTGVEFEDARPYQVGDDVRAIDWNVTARTGEPFVKTFVEERQLSLLFAVDTSASMDFGSVRVSKRELAAEFCALLAQVAMLEQDQVGLLLFGDGPELFLPPRKGQEHVMRVVREVVAASGGRSGSAAHPASMQPVRADAGAALALALEHLERRLRRRALVFLVSDFLGAFGAAEPAWTRVLARLARRHDAIAVRVLDPLEEELPDAGLLWLADLESGAQASVDSSSRRVRERWAADAAQRRERLQTELSRAGVDRIELSTRDGAADPVLRFFDRRARARRRA